MRLAVLVLILMTSKAWAMPQDSIGVRYVNGQKCIVHEVDKKETLYAISKKYNVKVADIQKWNTIVGTKIKKGQQLYIMVTPKNETPANTEKRTYHIVQKGEGLWSISKKYHVTVNDIKEWNDLESDVISVGQKLQVVAPEAVEEKKAIEKESKFHKVVKGETMYSIARTYDMSVEELKKVNNLKSNELKIDQLLIVKVEKGKKVEDHETPVKIESFHKVEEEGTAGIIYREEYNTKFSYCLHKTAPVGTIIKVINKSSGDFMYAKVMGNLPKEDEGIIRVNKTVRDKIGGGNNSFDVKITYIL